MGPDFQRDLAMTRDTWRGLPVNITATIMGLLWLVFGWGAVVPAFFWVYIPLVLFRSAVPFGINLQELACAIATFARAPTQLVILLLLVGWAAWGTHQPWFPVLLLAVGLRLALEVVDRVVRLFLPPRGWTFGSGPPG
jgi:hypothetical protein